MKLMTVSATGQKGELTVNDQIFGAKVNQVLLAQAIRVYLANQRQGTKATKTRAVVNRTKRKWYKQKGTGNARHGARSAPIFVGGGVAHGPKSWQNFKLNLSPRMKRQALICALSAQVPNMLVVDSLSKLEGQTRRAAKLLTKVGATARRILIVLSQVDPVVNRSLRNLPRVLLTPAATLNTWETAAADQILLTSQAITDLETRLLSHAQSDQISPTTQTSSRSITPVKTTSLTKLNTQNTPTTPSTKSSVKKNTPNKIARSSSITKPKPSKLVKPASSTQSTQATKVIIKSKLTKPTVKTTKSAKK